MGKKWQGLELTGMIKLRCHMLVLSGILRNWAGMFYRCMVTLYSIDNSHFNETSGTNGFLFKLDLYEIQKPWEIFQIVVLNNADYG